MKKNYLEEWRQMNLIKIFENDICRLVGITKEELKKMDIGEVERLYQRKTGKRIKEWQPLKEMVEDIN